MAELTYAQVSAVLKYDPETGKLLWKERDASMFTSSRVSAEQQAINFNKAYAGKFALDVAGNLGYKKGKVLGHTLLAHRVAWLLLTKKWPGNFIDHINGNRADNRAANLRDVTRIENAKNMSCKSRNTTGCAGVRKLYVVGGVHWQARITVNKKMLYLGTFTHFEEAITARKYAEKRYGFSDRHGT